MPSQIFRPVSAGALSWGGGIYGEGAQWQIVSDGSDSSYLICTYPTHLVPQSISCPHLNLSIPAGTRIQRVEVHIRKKGTAYMFPGLRINGVDYRAASSYDYGTYAKGEFTDVWFSFMLDPVTQDYWTEEGFNATELFALLHSYYSTWAGSSGDGLISDLWAEVFYDYPAPALPPVTPDILTLPVSEVAGTSALLRGYVGPSDELSQVQVCFEYGPSRAYEFQTPPRMVAPGSNFTERVSGLTPGQTYYYRVKAINATQVANVPASIGGYLIASATDSEWSALRNQVLASQFYSMASTRPELKTRYDGTTDKFDFLSRAEFSFDTSNIPDAGTILAGVFRMMAIRYYGGDQFKPSPLMHVVQAAPLSYTQLMLEDYSQFGNVKLSNGYHIGDIPDPNNEWNQVPPANRKWTEIDLLPAAFSLINKAGMTSFGLRMDWDIDGVLPALPPDHGEHQYIMQFAETGVNKAVLDVYYLVPAMYGSSPDVAFNTTVLQNFTLTTGVSPAGTGTVDNPGGSYPEGSILTLVAMAVDGYRFSHWVIDGIIVDQNPVDVAMVHNVLAIAHFVEETTPTYTLVTGADPASAGTVTPGGSYSEGTQLSLVAAAYDGWRFVQWEINGIMFTANPLPLTMNMDVTAIAHFQEEGVPPAGDYTGILLLLLAGGAVAVALGRRDKGKTQSRGKK